MCIVFLIIEYVSWCLRVIFIEYVRYWGFVCELSEIPCYLYCFVISICERDEWPSPKDSESLSFPSLHSLLMWLHFMFWSESITTFLHISIVSLSFLSLLVIHLIPFTSFSLLTVTHLGFDTPHHHYTCHYQFILLHLSPYRYHIHVRHSQVHGSWGSLYMLHFIYEGVSFDHWVFEPSFLSFLSPYHLGLRYVPCLKTTLRPWDQMSSSSASTWTRDWDLVDV